MKLKIATLPGDGIGPEVTNEAIKVLKINKISYSRTLFSPQFSINIFKEFFSIIQIIFILCKMMSHCNFKNS